MIAANTSHRAVSRGAAVLRLPPPHRPHARTLAAHRRAGRGDRHSGCRPQPDAPGPRAVAARNSAARDAGRASWPCRSVCRQAPRPAARTNCRRAPERADAGSLRPRRGRLRPTPRPPNPGDSPTSVTQRLDQGRADAGRRPAVYRHDALPGDRRALHRARGRRQPRRAPCAEERPRPWCWRRGWARCLRPW